MIKREDWKTVDMPKLNETFIFERRLTNNDIELIKVGYKPKDMENKWFMFFEKGKLFIHRSWTGHCIYIVNINTSGQLSVVVNRDTNQYKGTNIEQDKVILNDLIDGCLINDENREKLIKNKVNEIMGGPDIFWVIILEQYLQSLPVNAARKLDLLNKLSVDKEIINEFSRYLVQKKFDIKDAICINGVTAKSIHEHNPDLNAMEVYIKLIEEKNK